MVNHRRVLLMLALFLLTSFSPVLMSSKNNHFSESLELIEPDYSEQQKLEMATMSWHQAASMSLTGVEQHRGSGLVQLSSGTFDPLKSNGPKVTGFLSDDFDYLNTGFALLQLEYFSGIELDELQSKYGFTVIDYLGDSTMLIRLPENTAEVYDVMSEDSQIRWIGNMHPGWRVSSEVLEIQNDNTLMIIPSSDLHFGGFEKLVLDLTNYGAVDAWCGIGACQVSLSNSNLIHFIDQASSDGRIIWIEQGHGLELHNAVAGAISGVVDVENSATFTLDGSGEMLAIADTGLDRDHPDISGRVSAIYTQFGLDSSPIDSNTGHGTHVTLTAIGDGSGDSSAKGMAPEALVTMYALEHDPTGVFGRQGSIYNLLLDAKQKTARIAINAWGLNGNFGEYTADSRSVDQFVWDEPSVLPIFSVGDRGSSGASQISPPGTAKNILSIGASTTGSSSSASAGAVAAISSQGPTLDGRIKPDLVAPGIEICSGRAEEAKSPSGLSCGTGVHGDGDPLYMSLSGTSQATAVTGGIASLTREFLREQMGISSPSASLIKAALINGATDLGAPDIPNNLEGWGQINLEQTILPTDDTTILSTYFDDKKSLRSGFGLLYDLNLDPSHGIDITLVWTDEAGSANSAQSQSKLVNNLDLILVDPSGNQWLGNDFASGFSKQGGTADDLNNVERIKIAPGTFTNSGNWLVKVMHRGGNEQDFSIVITGDMSIQPKSDLTTFNESIYLSSQNPLQNDVVSVRVAWMNQGTLDTTGFHWILEDLTEGTILMQGDSQGVASSEVESVITTRSFSTTGIHTLKLSLDTDNVIQEMNDESSGIDNNIITTDIEVTSLGVRVIALNEDGSEPVSPEDRAASAIKIFDVRNETGIDVPVRIKNEGTGTQSVTLSVTNVQEKHPIYNYFIVPEDAWTKQYSDNGPFSLTGQGSSGDYKDVILRFENEYANLDDSNNPRYARFGTFYVDITVQYQSLPTVSHSQRLTIEIGQVDDVNVVSAGTSGLAAKPGESVAFSISAQNVGNSAAQYSVTCESENRWQIMLGNSNSSTLDFEPLDISAYLSMPVRIFVPPVAYGLPAVGETDQISCYVTSTTDLTLNYSEVVTVSVMEKEEFQAHLLDDGVPVGTNLITRDVLVDSGEIKFLDYEIRNLGNSILDMDISIQPSNPSWFLKAYSDTENDSRKVSITIQPGDSQIVQFQINVPTAALEGDSNSFTLRAEISDFNYVTNTTRILVKEDVSLELTGPESLSASISSDFSYNDLMVSNTGNSVLNLNWSYSLPPDGWLVGFSNPVKVINPREQVTVSIGLVPPLNEEISLSSFSLTVSVSAESNGRSVMETLQFDVKVEESPFGNLSSNTNSLKDFIGIEVGNEESQIITFRNDGNTIIEGDVSAIVTDLEGVEVSGWNTDVKPSKISGLMPGDSIEFEVMVEPKDGAEKGSFQILINVTSDSKIVAQMTISSSIQSSKGNSGLFNSVPWYISVLILSTLLVSGVIFARRMKRSGSISSDDSQLVSADNYVNPEYISNRRDEALDIGNSVNEITSGEVSADEIAAALAQSMELPSFGNAPNIPKGMPPKMNIPAGMPPKLNLPPVIPLPKINPPLPQTPALTRPLPPTGLPPGWSVEQWNAYGHMWLEQNNK
ncbi:MAG: hypothetical protein DWB99_00475 [Candidatus Poseidoniales archaeon]|nr:MAG: hypothetical protein DWB99_00475 [Candidatus Poseidoniales archaeon]